MRILIVEDDPSIHRIISRRLKEEGYAVDDCYDGEEGGITAWRHMTV